MKFEVVKHVLESESSELKGKKKTRCSLLKTFIHQDTSNKMNEQAKECQEIFISYWYISEKGLLSRIYKELSELKK